MVLPIYIYGHPVLRKVAEEIDENYEGLNELIQNMKETMYATDGIGIAAPQVGKSIRVIYIDVDVLADKFPELKGKNMVLINPILTVDEYSPIISREEGCLSVPDIHENVARHSRIHLNWLDENWQEHDEEIEGYLARVVQHEYDHLEGKLFIDHISPIRKQLNRRKLNNIASGKMRFDYRTVGYKPTKKS
ncbi:MAG: peptide deformylase [Muribaculaceae bacterium]|nr:peptide deformylase [Muribaculaceae bacterium]